jgi:hypothetical protein
MIVFTIVAMILYFVINIHDEIGLTKLVSR